MKKNKYIILILIMFFNLSIVNAECTSEELKELKSKAEEIKVTYKHMGKSIDDYQNTVYNQYEVKIKNISDDFYVMLFSEKIEPKDNLISLKLNDGTWNFNIYSSKCEEKLDTIKVKIPKFNEYSLDPLCEGIDEKEFALCGKYYNYNISYEEFEKRVNNYRITHKIEKKIAQKNLSTFEKILNYIKKYLYIIICVLILITIAIVIVIKHKRKKRGVLK